MKVKSENISDFPALIDLNDPDDTEFKLIEWSHDVSIKGERAETRAVGRIIKTLVPAFCEVLRQERSHPEGSPASVLNGLTNGAGLMIALALIGSVRQDKALETTSRVAEALELSIRSHVLGVENRTAAQDNGGTNYDARQSHRMLGTPT